MSAGILHRHHKTLLAISTEVNTDQTGDTKEILPAHGDSANDTAQGFQVHFLLGQTGGATSPTSILKLQTSVNGTNWVDVVSSTQLTTDGVLTETKDISSPLLKYVRVVSELGGGTKPSHSGSASLVSNAGFKLV